ncbi:MAG: restriction endonuclease subunit R, partial [Candidatus Aminicenantes bacterium]|nr:restriction endonuclease subunit R [Candidatus Aminicenantes bacterium]
MSKVVVIENPILNSPYVEPKRHFRFSEEGITNEKVEARRKSAYFIPVPRSKKKAGAQPLFKTEWTEDRIEENKLINNIRERVSLWRAKGRPYTTRITSQLIDYWTRPEREKRLFFCQVEALETIIY